MSVRGLNTVLVTAALTLAIFAISTADHVSVKEGILEEKSVGRSDLIIDAEANLFSKIQVITNQRGDIKATYEIKARAESKSEADRYLGLVDVRLGTGVGRARLEILAPSHVPWSGTKYSVNADILLEVPEKINIRGDCRFVRTEIIGPFQDIDLDCENSSLSLNQIYGSIRVSTTNGHVRLSSISGDIRVETTNGTINMRETEIESGYAFLETTNGAITIDGIRGSVEAYTTYSPIKAENIDASEGSVVLRTNYAPIDVSNVSGEIICETSYNEIIIENALINHGHSKIETSYAPIKARLSGLENSEVYISSDYNDVELKIPKETSTRLVASVDRGGKIHAKDIAIIPIMLEPTRLEGILGEGEARMEIKVKGVGNIDITGINYVVP